MSVREPDPLREHIDALQKQVAELRDSAERALGETSEQVEERIRQVKAQPSAQQETLRDKAGQAAGHARSPWQSIKADAAARFRDAHDRIDRRREELDVKKAGQHAEAAEEDALDALDLAWLVTGQAELAVLDAIAARAWADERAASSRAK